VNGDEASGKEGQEWSGTHADEMMTTYFGAQGFYFKGKRIIVRDGEDAVGGGCVTVDVQGEDALSVQPMAIVDVSGT
jgi:hypothetical protein